jgi:hypothetical protein
MAIETSIDGLAAAINALAAAIAGASAGVPASGKSSTPAATRTAAATTTANPAAAVESPSEGKPAADTKADAATQTTAKESAAPAEKEKSSEQKVLDYDKDVKPAFLQLVREKGRAAAIALIAEYDPKAEKLNEAITPEQYGDVIARIKELLP